MWFSEEQREQAKKVNLIEFLKEYHPFDLIQKQTGEYAYANKTCLTFFKGRDGKYRYCDHGKRLKGEQKYCGDGIEFLVKYLRLYTFEKAVKALLEFEEKEQKGHR